MSGRSAGKSAGSALGEQLLVAVLEVDDVLHARGEILDRSVGEQHLRLRVLERVAELGVGVALVQRDEHHARTGHRLVQLDVAVAVRADHGDPVAVAETEPSQPAREAPAPVPCLGVGELDVAARDGRSVRRRSGSPGGADRSSWSWADRTVTQESPLKSSICGGSRRRVTSSTRKCLLSVWACPW